jgi:four helix bundle protein
MAESIEKLRMYQLAVQLEDQVVDLVRQLPAEQRYPLGNDARRASAAVSHHINQAHQRFAYQLKQQELAEARDQAERARQLLDRLREFGVSDELIEGYVTIIKQSWSLSKWLKTRQAERQTQAAVQATDELVAARS